MELMLNELSIHEQFYSSSKLREAIGRIMMMRNIARRYGREVYCHRSALYRTARPGTPLVQMLSREQRSATMQWLTRQGPFWDDTPRHDPNEWFECNDEPVTEAGLAEAAYCSTIGMDRRMVSLAPSVWEYSPITVTWCRDDTTSTDVDLGNYWDPPELEADLRQADPAIESWRQLEAVSRQRCSAVEFHSEQLPLSRWSAIRPWRGHPDSQSYGHLGSPLDRRAGVSRRPSIVRRPLHWG